MIVHSSEEKVAQGGISYAMKERSDDGFVTRDEIVKRVRQEKIVAIYNKVIVALSFQSLFQAVHN